MRDALLIAEACRPFRIRKGLRLVGSPLWIARGLELRAEASVIGWTGSSHGQPMRLTSCNRTLWPRIKYLHATSGR